MAGREVLKIVVNRRRDGKGYNIWREYYNGVVEGGWADEETTVAIDKMLEDLNA